MEEIMWHAQSSSEVLRTLQSSKQGLTSAEAEERIKKFGPNILPEPEVKGKSEILFNQFRSPFAVILLLAVGVSFALGDLVNATVVLLVLLANVFLGYFQESKANRALIELRKLLDPRSTVLRGGAPLMLRTKEIVPGDVLLLSSGDKISADGRIFESHDFKVNEASLTGESMPITKISEALPQGTSLPERRNMVYSGTSVLTGRARVVAVTTGRETEFGKIAGSAAGIKEESTPLQRELIRFSRHLGALVVSTALLLLAIGLVQGREFAEMFATSVAVAVAAVPEGLPVVITVILAIGMRGILKRKALVRKLIAAETLGSVTVIAADKTGTLTYGEVRVSHLWTPDEDEISSHEAGVERRSSHLLAMRIGTLCNDALPKNPHAELHELEIIGDPIDRALFLAGREAGLEQDKLAKESPRVDEIPFDAEKKYMATLHRIDGHHVVYMKGAPELVLSHSSFELLGGQAFPLSPETKKRIKLKIDSLTKLGLRAVAVAYRLMGDMTKFDQPEIVSNDFVFAGVFGMSDPVREGVGETINFAAKAGVRTIMITGDHSATAKAIAREVGILRENDSVLDGVAISKLNDKELQEAVKTISVYARIEPREKVRIVDALRANGEVVAMTGDGVNDAPALKAAAIGVALGSGTDVAKETSDMVLLDNNIKTIVSAIEAGRTIFDNIRKVVLYLLTSSFSEVILVAGSLFLRLPLPVLPAQILWVNMAEDALPNMSLAFDSGDRDLMKNPPRGAKEPIINRQMRYLVAIISLVTDTLLFGFFVFLLRKGLPLDQARTFIFVALGLDSLFFIFVVRSLRHAFWQKNPFDNPFLVPAVAISLLFLVAAVYLPALQRILSTVPLTLAQWTVIVSLAIFKMFFIEFNKWLFLNHKKT